MRHSEKALAVGVTLLVSAIVTDLVGSSLQLLAVLIFSFALAVGGAVVAARGLFEFLADRL